MTQNMRPRKAYGVNNSSPLQAILNTRNAANDLHYWQFLLSFWPPLAK
jgi:hypothetical protein